MNAATNRDKVEAFLFDLNELMREHRATISPSDDGATLLVSAGGQFSEVTTNGEQGYLETK